MNFNINKNELSNALSIVSHAVFSNSPQASLRGIKIEVKNDSLILTGSDSDISIQKTIQKNEDNNLNITEEGSILIDSKYVLDIVKKIDSENVQVEIIDGSLTRFSGASAVFKINGMNVYDYPKIDFSLPEEPIVMKQSELASIIEETAFAASLKETRPVLTGVNFKLNENELIITATDSYRLAKKVLHLETSHSFNITIPSKSLNEVKTTMLTSNDTISIYQNNKKVQFVIDDMILQSRLLDGGYPETDRLIPSSFSYTLKMNRQDLIKAIDRTTFIKNDNMTINKLQCSVDEVVITNKSQEIGESREVLNAEWTGDPLNISFSGNYVMDAAKALKDDEIIIEFTGEMKPFILKNLDDDSVIQLVLPVRTYN